MPPKTKRQLQTREAARLGREALKKVRINVESEDPQSPPETLVTPPQVSLPQSSEETRKHYMVAYLQGIKVGKELDETGD